MLRNAALATEPRVYKAIGMLTRQHSVLRVLFSSNVLSSIASAFLCSVILLELSSIASAIFPSVALSRSAVDRFISW